MIQTIVPRTSSSCAAGIFQLASNHECKCVMCMASTTSSFLSALPGKGSSVDIQSFDDNSACRYDLCVGGASTNDCASSDLASLQCSLMRYLELLEP